MPLKPGFIQLSPELDFRAKCPACGTEVQATSWQMPGLWSVAELKCPACGTAFIHDLPYSLGVVTPFVLDVKTGKTTPSYFGQWYADLTAEAWGKRAARDVPIRVVRNPRGKAACLVNCLYPWWGDAVSLLLRVNQIRRHSDIEIIVLINSALAWLVPDYVAGVWVVEQDVLKNYAWNDSLSVAVKALGNSLGLELYLPVIFQPAYLTRKEVEEATKFKIFPRGEWAARLAEKPVVTFMWRTDRLWSTHELWAPQRLGRRIYRRLTRHSHFFGTTVPFWLANRDQVRHLRAFAEALREVFPKLEFAVCGIGRQGSLPEWIKDMREDSFGPETNYRWCRQAAESHVLCGVHGSQMTLPGALAGSYLELTPNDRLRNVLTCAPVTSEEAREAILVHRFLPINTDPRYLADVAATLLINYSYTSVAFMNKYQKPLTPEDLEEIRDSLEARRKVVETLAPADLDRLGN